MKNKTLILPGFHLQTLRRKPRSAQQKLADKLSELRHKTFKQIGDYLKSSFRILSWHNSPTAR